MGTTTTTGPQLAPYLEAQRSSRGAALFILTVLLGPATLLLGALLYGIARLINRNAVWLVLVVLLAIGLGYAGWHWRDIAADGLALWAQGKPLYAALQHSVAQARGRRQPPVAWKPLALGLAWGILHVWRWGLLGVPLIALYLNGTRLITAEAQERQRAARQQQALQTRSEAAKRQSTRAPQAVQGQLVLGAPVAGDLDWLMKQWVVYPPDVLGRHLVLIGASGQGKSETALRLAAGAAQVYGWQVFFLDAKGDRAMADRFWAAMTVAGANRLAMLPQRPYHGWRGDATALLNRLLGVLEFTEAYYRDLTKMVLSLAVDAPEGPPQSSSELLARLHLDALSRLYDGHPDGRELGGLKDEHVAAVYNRYRAFFRALRGQLDGDWAWEDVDAGYLLLDGLALKDQAVSLGRYLLEDFAHYVATRKDPRRRVLLIVDEFSALAIGGTDAASLFERVRSYGAAVVVTSQSAAGLGQGADRILGAAATVLLHQCPDPESLIARAGTAPDLQHRRSAIERLGLGGIRSYATGQVAYAETDRAKVRIEVVQQLEPGECVLISGGDALRLRVSQLPLDVAQVAAAHAAIAQQPRRQTRPSDHAVPAVAATTQPTADTRDRETSAVVQPTPEETTPPATTTTQPTRDPQRRDW